MCTFCDLCILEIWYTYTTQYWVFKVLVGEENVVVITDIITFEIDTEKQREHSWQRDADREWKRQKRTASHDPYKA